MDMDDDDMGGMGGMPGGGGGMGGMGGLGGLLNDPELMASMTDPVCMTCSSVTFAIQGDMTGGLVPWFG